MQYAQKLPALFQHTAARRRLVAGQRQAIQDQIGFNTQPPEGGWTSPRGVEPIYFYVSTHSRPKAAGSIAMTVIDAGIVSTHSRPKAAG